MSPLSLDISKKIYFSCLKFLLISKHGFFLLFPPPRSAFTSLGPKEVKLPWVLFENWQISKHMEIKLVTAADVCSDLIKQIKIWFKGKKLVFSTTFIQVLSPQTPPISFLQPPFQSLWPGSEKEIESPNKSNHLICTKFRLLPDYTGR